MGAICHVVFVQGVGVLHGEVKHIFSNIHIDADNTRSICAPHLCQMRTHMPDGGERCVEMRGHWSGRFARHLVAFKHVSGKAGARVAAHTIFTLLRTRIVDGRAFINIVAGGQVFGQLETVAALTDGARW